MKKSIFPILLLMSLFSRSQTLQTDCVPTGHSSLLGYQESVGYVKNYHKNHEASLDNHTKAVYMSDTVILFLQDFFNHASNSKYFGFCVYLINYNDVSGNPHQRKSSQSFLHIVPVCERINGTKKDTVSAFNAFNIFYVKVKTDPKYKSLKKLNNTIICQGTGDSSIINWTYQRDIAMDEKRLHSSDFNYTRDYSSNLLFEGKHKTYRDNYRNGQGAEYNEKQTRRVYFNKLTIEKIFTFLSDGDNLKMFPVMGMYFGSYDKMVIKGQAHEKQTMIGFIPMRKMDSGFLEPDICSYVSFWNIRFGQGDTLAKKTENHGTLCPTQCPRGGD